MIEYKMQVNCGCCEEDGIWFENDEQAIKAVDALGLTVNGTLVDAKGYTHTDLDTFYGITRVDFVDNRNSIQKLLDQL